MSKVTLKVEVEEDYLKSIKVNTNKTSSDIILNNATPIIESEDAVSRQVVKEQMLKYGFRAPDMTVTEFVEDLPLVIPKHEGNTVSEEVYTEEYLQRKKLEYELYVLKKKISELI